MQRSDLRGGLQAFGHLALLTATGVTTYLRAAGGTPRGEFGDARDWLTALYAAHPDALPKAVRWARSLLA